MIALPMLPSWHESRICRDMFDERADNILAQAGSFLVPQEPAELMVETVIFRAILF